MVSTVAITEGVRRARKCRFTGCSMLIVCESYKRRRSDGFYLQPRGGEVPRRGSSLDPGECTRRLGLVELAHTGKRGGDLPRNACMGSEAARRRMGGNYLAQRVRRAWRDTHRAIHIPGGDGRLQ